MSKYRRLNADVLEVYDEKSGESLGSFRWPIERDHEWRESGRPYRDPRGFVVEPLMSREKAQRLLEATVDFVKNEDGSWTALDENGDALYSTRVSCSEHNLDDDRVT